MAERKTVLRDFDGFRRTLITDDDNPDSFSILTEQVVDEILASVERDRENQKERGINRLLARIPIEVYEESVRNQWDEGDWKRYLNSTRAAPYRIWPGQV